MNGVFNPTCSSNDVWYDTNLEECLTTHIEGIESDITALETGKSDTTHTHSYNDLTDKPTTTAPEYSETSVYCNGVLAGNVLAVKYGSVVTLYATSLNTGTTGLTSGGVIGTLPDGYRPQYTNCFYIGNTVWNATFMIGANGVMNIGLGSNSISPYQNVIFTCTYVI